MNIYPFRILLGRKNWGKSYQILQYLKKSSTFKRAHFRVYIPNKHSKKVIIALGQVHTVLTGRISGRTAKKIAKNQARLYMYYRYFFRKIKIAFFGEEGVTHQVTSGLFRYNLDGLNQSLSTMEKEYIKSGKGDYGGLKKILIRLSLKWQSMLSMFQNSPAQVSPYANVVSGATLYSLENSDVSFFAIEGEKSYRFVLNKITSLEQDISRAKSDFAFKEAVAKGYKKLTQNEYNAVKICNAKVKLFNQILGSTLRDEATLQSFKDRLLNQDVLVYTIGMAHEKNLFKLANGMLKDDNISLIMIMSPELWFWKAVLKWIKLVFWMMMFFGIVVLWFVFVVN